MQRADVTSISTPAGIAGFARVSRMAQAPRLLPAAAVSVDQASVDQSSGVVGAGRCIRFGRFVLQMRERRLLADGMPVELGSRALDVLAVLAESGGGLLTKSMIMDLVWPDVAVEENNLQVQISNLRRVFGTDRGWIVTIPGRGYGFTAPVDAAPQAGAAKTARPLSVLVLPFAARGSDPALDWFVDGVTDSLTTDLAHAVPPMQRRGSRDCGAIQKPACRCARDRPGAAGPVRAGRHHSARRTPRPRECAVDRDGVGGKPVVGAV